MRNKIKICSENTNRVSKSFSFLKALQRFKGVPCQHLQSCQVYYFSSNVLLFAKMSFLYFFFYKCPTKCPSFEHIFEGFFLHFINKNWYVSLNAHLATNVLRPNFPCLKMSMPWKAESPQPHSEPNQWVRRSQM